MAKVNPKTRRTLKKLVPKELLAIRKTIRHLEAAAKGGSKEKMLKELKKSLKYGIKLDLLSEKLKVIASGRWTSIHRKIAGNNEVFKLAEFMDLHAIREIKETYRNIDSSFTKIDQMVHRLKVVYRLLRQPVLKLRQPLSKGR